MANYTKPYLSVAKQLSLLQSRGMVITDSARAENYLARIGYYRLSAYWFPFRESKPGHGKRSLPKILDTFRPGTRFQTIVDLYVFDKMLRLLALDALERVEVALRTDISLALGKRDAWAHRDSHHLDGQFAKKRGTNGSTEHTKWLGRLDKSFADSKEDFAAHFKNKYQGSHPPLWIAVELMDFGMISYLFGGLLQSDRDTIANKYGLPTGPDLHSWIRCLNVTRNTCAHHARLWNKPLVSQPRFPAKGVIPELDHLLTSTMYQTRFYGAAAVLMCLLRKINPATTWPKRLVKHVRTFPRDPLIDLRSGGFPPRWHKYDLWKGANVHPLRRLFWGN